MSTKNIKDFKTLAFAGKADFLKSLTDQLDQLPQFKKYEEGSQTDPDGHVITYKAKLTKDGEEIDLFWAMINSDHVHYLIRADKNLFEEVA